MDYAAEMADIFVTCTGNYHVITHDHMVKMKDQAIVCNIGHFDNEIDVASMKKYTWDNIKPQVDHIILPNGNRIILLAEGRLVNLAAGDGQRPDPKPASGCHAGGGRPAAPQLLRLRLGDYACLGRGADRHLAAGGRDFLGRSPSL